MAKDKKEKSTESSIPFSSSAAPISSIGSASSVEGIRRIQALQANTPLQQDVSKLDVGKSFNLSDQDFSERSRMASGMSGLINSITQKAKDLFNQPVKNLTFSDHGHEKLIHQIPPQANTRLFPAWKAKNGIFINSGKFHKNKGKIE